MESILPRALGYTLKSFSREQFKLQGRNAQLSNLDINGDAVHSSMGLPAVLHVSIARVRKLDITVPADSTTGNVNWFDLRNFDCFGCQWEPVVVQIDRSDVVLEENTDPDDVRKSSSAQTSTSSAKGSGY